MQISLYPASLFLWYMSSRSLVQSQYKELPAVCCTLHFLSCANTTTLGGGEVGSELKFPQKIFKKEKRSFNNMWQGATDYPSGYFHLHDSLGLISQGTHAYETETPVFYICGRIPQYERINNIPFSS